MQGDGNGDGALGSQGGHGSLRLRLVAGGFDPGAAQVRKLVELDAVLLYDSGTRQCWTWFCGEMGRDLFSKYCLVGV